MKKVFEIPELIIIQFTDKDIITSSTDYDEAGEGGSLDD